MYFEIHKNLRTRQYWFVIKSAGNHQVLATSESYVHKAGVMNAIEIIANDHKGEYFDRTGE